MLSRARGAAEEDPRPQGHLPGGVLRMLWVRASLGLRQGKRRGICLSRQRRAMLIKLNYTGYLKFEGVETGTVLELEEGTTVGDLLARFEVAPEQQRFLRIFANEEKAAPSYVLKDGDELTVIMQIGGG